MATAKETTTEPSNTRPRRLPNVRIIQNFHLVWLDGNTNDVNNEDCRNSITKLREVVNTVNTFTDVNKCIEFINGIEEERTFMISSGAFGQTVVPAVHEKPQVNSIYIFCGNKARHEQWTKDWSKIKGVFTDITPICEALKQAAHECDHNSVSISFVKKTDSASDQSLDTLDQSFMYTQILKEILLTIDFDQSYINDFLSYCRTELSENPIELKNVGRIEKEYRQHRPIWWYTYESFLYSMLNRALRLMDVDLIVKMGFFIRDLHNHIAELHTEQYAGQQNSDSFIVYRGQGLSQTDFDQLQSSHGGLLAFNNFLSTSEDRKVSLTFTQRTIDTSSLVGVLFVLKIDPSISGTPFANVADESYYRVDEKEILFSMHSVFRIGKVKQINANARLWQADLTLTSDKDPQLHALTKSIQEETKGSTGWHRLTQLMIRLGHVSKAEEFCNILLEQTTDESEKAQFLYQLGWIKDDQENYEEAVKYYEEALEIEQKTLPEDHPSLATSYNNIGLVYYNMGQYSEALSYYEKALKIKQKTLSANHTSLATSYNNIGLVYKSMGESLKALSYYEKALEIKQKGLPTNHPSLATSYNNIGGLYYNMKEYSKSLSYYVKDLEISQKSLPADHPDLATSYNNIGLVYDDMGDYSKALSYYEKTLQIKQKTLPTNHPNITSMKDIIKNCQNENINDFVCVLFFFVWK